MTTPLLTTFLYGNRIFLKLLSPLRSRGDHKPYLPEGATPPPRSEDSPVLEKVAREATDKGKEARCRGGRHRAGTAGSHCASVRKIREKRSTRGITDHVVGYPRPANLWGIPLRNERALGTRRLNFATALPGAPASDLLGPEGRLRHVGWHPLHRTQRDQGCGRRPKGLSRDRGRLVPLYSWHILPLLHIMAKGDGGACGDHLCGLDASLLV
jgi:hypothetical protein